MAETMAQAAARLRAAADDLGERLYRAGIRAALHMEGLAKDNATTRPQARSGTLRRSIRAVAERQGLRLTVGVEAGSERINYARLQEEGGTVRPVRGRFLVIPLPPALTGAGVPRYSGPRAAGDLRFVPIRGGQAGLLVRTKGAGEALYLLVREARIPATRFLGRAMDDGAPRLRDEASAAVRATVEGVADAG